MRLITNEKDLNLVTGGINKTAASVIGGLIGFTLGIVFVVIEFVVCVKIENKIIDCIIAREGEANLTTFSDDEKKEFHRKFHDVAKKIESATVIPLGLLTLGGFIASGVFLANKIYKETHKTNNK